LFSLILVKHSQQTYTSCYTDTRHKIEYSATDNSLSQKSEHIHTATA